MSYRPARLDPGLAGADRARPAAAGLAGAALRRLRADAAAVVSDNVGRAFSEAGSSMFTLGYSAPAGSGDDRARLLRRVHRADRGRPADRLPADALLRVQPARDRGDAAGRRAPACRPGARSCWPAPGSASARTPTSARCSTPLFTTWERWSAEVAESHSTYLTLTQLRSPRPLSHWVTSLLAVMDAAAMHLALSPDDRAEHQRPAVPADGLHRDGPGRRGDEPAGRRRPRPRPPADRGELRRLRGGRRHAAHARLPGRAHATSRPGRTFAAGGSTTSRSRSPWPTPPTRRPALWSGPRRWPSTPLPPSRPANRRSREVEPTARAVAYDPIVASARAGRVPEAAAPDHPGAAGEPGPGGQLVVGRVADLDQGQPVRGRDRDVVGPHASAPASTPASPDRGARRPTASSAPTSERTIE